MKKSETSEFSQLIQLDRHLYHQHVVRKSRRITALMGDTFGILLFSMLIVLCVLLIDYCGATDDYRDWADYLSGRNAYIDITGIGEVQPVCTETWADGAKRTYNVTLQVTIPYQRAELISEAKSAAILTECPDGILRCGWLDLEQVREYVSDQQYSHYHEPGIFFYDIQYEVGIGHNLHVWIFRTHQNLTKFLHLRSNIGIIWWFVAILYVLLVVFELIDSALKQERRRHLYYCQTDEDLDYVSPADKSEESTSGEDSDSEASESAE